MDNLLSIVVLSYRNGSLLKETIDSILSQDYPEIEIVICDDASPNFSREEISDYISKKKRANIKNIRIIENETNQGTVKNLNNGIKAASGAFIKAIAGDDCIANGDVFSRQTNYLKVNTDKFLVVGNSVECDEKMTPLKETGFMFRDDRDALLSNNGELLKYICRTNQNALATQSICFRHDFFDEYGLYDERFGLIEDLPMAVRIVSKEVPFGYINYPCVKHRGKVGVSTSNNAFDIKKLTYYEDLEKYFRLCLIPIKNKIGRIYVTMRHKVAEFRIEYCTLDSGNKIGKIQLIIKYALPLAYYSITKAGRVLFYLKK